jgi:hypothetical protein
MTFVRWWPEAIPVVHNRLNLNDALGGRMVRAYSGIDHLPPTWEERL